VLEELDRFLTMASEKEAALAAVPNDNPTMWVSCTTLSFRRRARTDPSQA
jgi:hypothetical protein